jgi:hypothetical protein
MRPPLLADQLLRAAVHPDRDVAARAAAAWSDAVDLDTLEFSSVQLLPMLAAREDPLPLDAKLADQITNVSRVTWLRTESHARVIAPTVAKLAAAGCSPVLMKGAALVYGHGIPSRLRPMFDVDVLVDPSKIAAAAQLLADDGFAARDLSGLLAAEQRLLTLKHGEEFTLGGGHSIDLHWSALQTLHKPELAETLIEHAIPTTIAGAECHALGRADLLAVTIAHAADPWRDIRERWVGDCVLLVRGHEQSIDWELFAARARQWRLASQILDAFAYLADVAELTLPSATERAIRRCPTPVAVRARSRRSRTPDGKARMGGKLPRLLEDYELEIADHVPIGERTGPGDMLDFLVRREGLSRRRELPGQLLFNVTGRRWRVRRSLGRLVGRRERPGNEADGWASYELGSWARFTDPNPPTQFLAAGWWFPEDFGVWSRGGCSHLRLGLERPIDGPLALSFGLRAPLGPGHDRVEVDVVVNEHRLLRLVLDQQTPASSFTVEVPAAATAGRTGVEIVFVVRDPVVPAELGTAPDQRQIGIGLGELMLTEAIPSGVT